MIFSELYSAYYNAIAEILRLAVKAELTEKDIKRVISEKAYAESSMTILPALKEERWQLLDRKLETKLKNEPTMPLTVLEKRWLKSVSLDPRVKLFGIELKGLDDVEPLFTADDYTVYDKYSDGDPYEDDAYIGRFRLILDALKNKYPLKVEMNNRKGERIILKIMPEKLEYSPKDDKFRLVSSGCRYGGTVNVARLLSCKRYYGEAIKPKEYLTPDRRTVTLTVKDERNALERVMLHFAHFEKRTEQLDYESYKLSINYDKEDETELVIRILSFGPLVKVISPDYFLNLIKERLLRQMMLGEL